MGKILTDRNSSSVAVYEVADLDPKARSTTEHKTSRSISSYSTKVLKCATIPIMIL